MNYEKIISDLNKQCIERWTESNLELSYIVGTDQYDYSGFLEYIELFKPKFIVEYGSGISTYLIDKLITKLDYGAEFISFEDCEHWYNKLKVGGVDINNRVHLVDLGFEEVNGKKGCRYIHDYDGYEKTDFVLLDGPNVNKLGVDTTLNLYDIVEKFKVRPAYWIDGRKRTKQFYRSLLETNDNYDDQLFIREDKDRWVWRVNKNFRQ